MKKFIFWAPRILTIMFALFLGLFALDVFDGSSGFWMMVAGFLIHLIPTILILAVLVLSWRKGWIGAIIYSGLGIYYLIMAWGEMGWIAYLSISGPLFLAGILYAIEWFFGKRHEETI